MTNHPQLTRAGTRLLCVSLVGALAVLAAAPPARASGRPESYVFAVESHAEELTQLQGAVYDGSGLPLIGALVAVALHGDAEPSALAVSDSRGRFVLSELTPGLYTLMARSFGHVTAVLPELAVPRLEPIRLQLRSERQAVSLFSPGSPVDIGWAFRSNVRDVLRKTEPTFVAGTDFDASWLSPERPNSIWDTVGGELSLWTAATGGGEIDDARSVTDLSLGSYEDARQTWAMRGQLAGGGIVRARSQISRVMSDSHVLRANVGFAGNDIEVLGDDEAHRMWVGSIAAEDYWRLGPAVQIGYGVRLDHYNYLEDTAFASPKVQLSFAPGESLTLTTGVSYGVQAPGLAELQFRIDPLTAGYVDILTADAIDPERTLSYEVGVQGSIATTEVRARAYFDEVSNELVAVYLANPNGTSDYFVANVGDSFRQGFELDLRRSFMDSFSGMISYAYAQRDGANVTPSITADRELLAGVEFDPEVATVEAIHELAAGLETVVGNYDTRLRAMYRWQTGAPVFRDGNMESVYERLDVRVRQPLPFRALASDWSALVQVQNVLGRSYDGVFDFRLGNAPVLSRLVTGGLAVRF